MSRLKAVILRRLLEHLRRNDMVPSIQLAYHKYHSMEFAMARVSDGTRSRWCGCTRLTQGVLGLLALLDLSVAFDTVNHSILLHRLRESFNLSSASLTWISSYVTGQQHSGSQSPYDSIAFGVRQGSVLGPLFFCTVYSRYCVTDPET